MAIERVLRESNPVSRTGILRDIHYTKDASTGIIVTNQKIIYKGIRQKNEISTEFFTKTTTNAKIGYDSAIAAINPNPPI